MRRTRHAVMRQSSAFPGFVVPTPDGAPIRGGWRRPSSSAAWSRAARIGAGQHSRQFGHALSPATSRTSLARDPAGAPVGWLVDDDVPVGVRRDLGAGGSPRAPDGHAPVAPVGGRPRRRLARRRRHRPRRTPSSAPGRCRPGIPPLRASPATTHRPTRRGQPASPAASGAAGAATRPRRRRRCRTDRRHRHGQIWGRAPATTRGGTATSTSRQASPGPRVRGHRLQPARGGRIAADI